MTINKIILSTILMGGLSINNAVAQSLSGLSSLLNFSSALDLSPFGNGGEPGSNSMSALQLDMLFGQGDPVTPIVEGIVLPAITDAMASKLLSAPDQYFSSMSETIVSGDFDPMALFPFLLIAPTSLLYDMDSQSGFIPVVGELDGTFSLLSIGM